jgi:hypothetical protein
MAVVLTLFVIARIIGGMTPEKSARARVRRAEFFGWFATTALNLMSAIRRRTPNAKEPS